MPVFAQHVTTEIDPDEVRGLVSAFWKYGEKHNIQHGSAMTAAVMLILFMMDPQPSEATIDHEIVQHFLDKWSTDVVAHQLAHHPDLDTTPQ